MKTGYSLQVLLAGFSTVAFQAAEATQAFREHADSLSMLSSNHPILTVLAHVGAIIAALGVFAIVLAAMDRGPSDY